MVFNYKKKRLSNYSPEQLTAAIEAVNNGRTIRGASSQFGVPYSTLQNHVKGTHVRAPGRTRVLSQEEEETIVCALEYSAQFGWPCTRQDVRKMVQDFCRLQKRAVPWGPDGPGKDFLKAFDQRWAHRIKKRKSELLTTAAARALSKDVLQEFFQTVRTLYDKHALHDHPERIFNLDETGLNTDGSAAASYFRKGAKSALALSPSAGKAQYSVLVCGNASGALLPPFVLYKSKHLYDSWCTGGPPGAQYGCTVSGWMESDAFQQWMEKVFIPHKKNVLPDSTALLFMDGHNSHLTLKVATMARENEVIILCFPPHSTHALQPLDIGFFAPFKKVWGKLLRNWYRESRQKAVDKAIFPTLLASLWKSANQHNLCRGFLGAGLHPLDISKPMCRLVVAEGSCELSSSSSSNSSTRKNLQKAILHAIAPEMSQETRDAIARSKRKRRRVQGAAGEIITDETAIRRLREEEEYQQSKKEKKKKGLKAAQLQQLPSLPNGPTIHNIRPDGNCLFAAFSMAVHGTTDSRTVRKVRLEAVSYIARNFSFFKDTLLATHDVPSKSAYVKKMSQDGVFGDHEELLALCQLYELSATIFTGPEFKEQPTINAAYNGNFDVHLHLEHEHYNLLLRTPRAGDWVLVNYDSVEYPGCVQEVTENGEYKVTALRKCGQSWVYPQSHDVISCRPANVGRRIIPPVPVGPHKQMHFKHCAPV